jgi:glycerophosphoryl diester phosphodiesterase
MSLWILHQKLPTKSPLIIAHRAGAANAPENTLAALKRTINDGIADTAEIDVTMTADSVLVIAHDKDLMKQAQAPAIIRETPYAELKNIDIGSFFSPEFKGEHLEKLSSFLLMAENRIPLIIEFKHGKDTNLVETTIKLIKELGMEKNVTLMSLEINEVRTIQQLAPEIKTGYFASIEIGDLRKLNVDIIGAKDSMITHEFIKDIQEKGIKVYAWTVDDPIRILKLIEFGVDGIITNDPNAANKILHKYKTLTPDQRILLRFTDFWDVLRQNWNNT